MNISKTRTGFGLLSFSRILVLISIFLIPLVFYPGNIYNFSNLKLGIFFGVSTLVLLLWSISKLKNDVFKFPSSLLALSIALILITSLVSSIFSDNLFASIFGVQLSVLSFSGILILFLSSLLIASLFESKKTSYIITLSVYFSLIVSVFVNLLYILIPVLPNFGFFVTNSANTIGKWSDLGIVSALAIIFSYLIIDFAKPKTFIKYLAWFGLVISVVTALIVSETIIWILLGIISIIYLVYKIVTSRSQDEETFNKHLPYASIIMILISFIMILAGSFISSFTDQWLGIKFSETKPSISSTLELNQKTLNQNLITGVGVNRFERAWQLYKPDGINITNYWGVDFKYGYSYLTSLPAQVGLLGVLAWLFFLVMVVWSVIKLLFKKTDDFIEDKIKVTHAFAVILLLIVLAIQVPSISVLILFFIFLGMFIGTLSRNKLYRTYSVSISNRPKLGFLSVFSVIVLMIFSVYLGYMFSKEFISTVAFERANYELSQNNFLKTQKDLILSVNALPTDQSFRNLSEYYRVEINRLLQDQSLENQSTVDNFRSLLTSSISAVNAAIGFDKNNYQNYVSLASIYEQLVLLKVDGAYDQAISAYQKAMEVNPNNPGIYLGMARSAFYAKKNDEAKDYIAKSLEMNSRFVDATFLLSQIQVSEGNVSDAIKSVEVSINIEPNNSNLYFQLGLLRYNQKDFDGAISAFESAVKLNPVFANAKYFLGLSYEEVGRRQDAVDQFKDLNFLNPDNQDIKDILNKLKAGEEVSSSNVSPDETVENLPVEEPVATE